MSENRPIPARLESFTHAPMCNWLSAGQLVQTGIRAAVASTVGSFADGREIAAALHPPKDNPPIELSGAANDVFWLDYLADTGDGWNSTYSVAYTLAQKNLAVVGLPQPLPRGDLLVLGGDQVYPTPAGGNYRIRFLDPFRSALPAPIPSVDTPDDPRLLAIPGNHDWYDGLRGFNQLFCRQQPIGRWQTLQRTSYFAARLPHGWWLWGLDLHLDTEIDDPQWRYFRGLARDQLQDGDRVILCVPEPSWIDESRRRASETEAVDRALHGKGVGLLRKLETQPPRFRSLRRVEQLIEDTPGVHLAAVLAGDQHHYAHYAPKPGSSPGAPQRMTCGGGGAYLLGTHQLPETLAFRGPSGEQAYQCQATFPDAAESRQLRNRVWNLPRLNPGFCVVLASFYLLMLWLLQSASKVPNPGLGNRSLMLYLADVPLGPSGLWQVLRSTMWVMAHSPASVIFTLVIVGGAAAWTSASAPRNPSPAFFGGLVHGLAHCSVALFLLWGIGHVNLQALAPWLGMPAAEFVDHPLQVALFVMQASVIGGLAGGLLTGCWLVASNALFGWHHEEVFSAQAIEGYKSFLRIAITPDALTIYPLKIEEVCQRWRPGPGIEVLLKAGRDWRLRPRAGQGSRFEPDRPISVELIEPPIIISSTKRPRP